MKTIIILAALAAAVMPATAYAGWCTTQCGITPPPPPPPPPRPVDTICESFTYGNGQTVTRCITR